MMSDSLVIVALPRKDENINKISSEKAAHVTLLYLGDASDISADIIQYVQHAVSTSFQPIYLEVSDRGTLGDKSADVVYFAGPGARQLAEFRSLLLKDHNLQKLHIPNDKFPTFTPHLTLGYPETPANEPEHQWSLSGFEVDRIAVWMGDSEGPEFKPPYHSFMEDAAASAWHYDKPSGPNVIRAPREEVVESEGALWHYGVKGMKWGRRKSERSEGSGGFPVSRSTDSHGNEVLGFGKDRGAQQVNAKTIRIGGKSEVRTGSGGYHEAHPDAVAAKSAAQKKRASGVDTLSNKELNSLAERMNLEQRIRDLESRQADTQITAGKKYIQRAVAEEGLKHISKAHPLAKLGYTVFAAAQPKTGNPDNDRKAREKAMKDLMKDDDN